MNIWWRIPILLAALAGGLVGILTPLKLKAQTASVEDRLLQFQENVRRRLAGDFEKAGAAWPPSRLDLLAFKQEKRLEVHVPGPGGRPVLLRAYPILAASGSLGPKLREGDRQVPEGIYGVEYLNPNSRFHLSMKLDYPNAFDRARAREDGRIRLGGDIMIHGNRVSIGCLAMGDAAAEELFVMAALAGVGNVRVLISPVDFRSAKFREEKGLPHWTSELYPLLAQELSAFPRRGNEK